jgi:hypothetical protein
MADIRIYGILSPALVLLSDGTAKCQLHTPRHLFGSVTMCPQV